MKKKSDNSSPFLSQNGEYYDGIPKILIPFNINV